MNLGGIRIIRVRVRDGLLILSNRILCIHFRVLCFQHSINSLVPRFEVPYWCLFAYVGLHLYLFKVNLVLLGIRSLLLLRRLVVRLLPEYLFKFVKFANSLNLLFLVIHHFILIFELLNCILLYVFFYTKILHRANQMCNFIFNWI